MTSAVILQSNYLPWRGYFDLIRDADVFIFYDEVQYTRGDWRNRNKIVAPNGERWLSLPIAKAGNFGQSIADTQISDQKWAAKHWDTLRGTYKSAPGFKAWKPFFADFFERCADETGLSAVNQAFTKSMCERLEIKTKFVNSTDLPRTEGKTEKLVSLCQAVGADTYISGPAAKSYLDTDMFAQAGIDLVWKTYPDYPHYPQQDGEYRPGVSIVDTLFQAPDLNLFGA